MDQATNGNGRLDILMRREAAVREAKAALNAAKAKERQRARRTAAEIHSLLGEAIASDLAAEPAELRTEQRAYMRQVLVRRYEAGSAARELLEANGWL